MNKYANRVRGLRSFRAVLLLSALAVLVGLVNSPVPAEAASSELVLWNTLGSDSEVLNSAFGPNLSFFTGGCGIDPEGDAGYVTGQFGNAATLIQSSCPPYAIFQRIHNIVLNNLPTHINPERGTVEAWYKQNTDPVAFSHGIYRIFGGGFGLGSGMKFESFDPIGSVPAELRFGLIFGGTQTLVTSNISAKNGQFIHIAGVWDRNGIQSTPETMRLYVDGIKVASTTGTGWGTTVGTRIDIVGGNDGNIVNKFFVDNLKIYNCAKTDFSDRFQEDSDRGCTITVEIDIKPGSDPNCFNNNGNGVIPVAILGSADFDVTQVDDSTVLLEGLDVKAVGKKGNLLSHIEDTNADGFDDLVVQIEDEDNVFQQGTSTATLTGNLLPAFGGTPFEGTDSICITQ